MYCFVLWIINYVLLVALATTAIILTVRKPLHEGKKFLLWSSVGWTAFTVPGSFLFLSGHTLLCEYSTWVSLNVIEEAVSFLLKAALSMTGYFAVFHTLPYLLLVGILAFSKFGYEIRKGCRPAHPKRILYGRRIAAALLLAVLLLNTVWVAAIQGKWKGDEGHSASEQITIRGGVLYDGFGGDILLIPFMIDSRMFNPHAACFPNFAIYHIPADEKLIVNDFFSPSILSQCSPDEFSDDEWMLLRARTFKYYRTEKDTTGWLLIPSLWMAVAEVGVWVGLEIVHAKRKKKIAAVG